MFNDHACFVMLFAQLENLINRKCDKLVARKKAAQEWKARRLWDSVDPERLAFLQKAALLCEKGQAIYNKIQGYYKTRCDIAHGESAEVGPIVLSEIAPDLLGIAGDLKG